MVNPFIPEYGGAINRLSPDDALRAMGIELSAATKRLYSNQRPLIWVNKPTLFEDLRAYAESHGIHDTFADSAVVNRLLATRNPIDRAMADRLMTESVIRTAKEISHRSDVTDISNAFITAMTQSKDADTAQTKIESIIDGAGPQHPFYADMRNQYEALLQKGNMADPKLASLRVNMAKVRQNGFDETVAKNSININIPQGFAQYNINGAMGTSNVIIGAPPVDGQPVRTTPIARGFVEGMEIQPTWYIPNSIAERKGFFKPEFIDYIRSEYQKSGSQSNLFNFVAHDKTNGTSEIYTVDWNKFNNPHVSPFSQPPSPTNPLGAIKVLLGGEFGRNSIRLHDTVASARGNSFTQYAQSSGCIRVQNIADVAAALAKDPELGQKYGYPNNKDFFSAIMQPDANAGNARPQWQFPQFANARIPIQPRIAIQTTYNTVTWDGQKAVIHNDIYKRDAQTERPSRNAMPPIQLEPNAAVTADQTNGARIPGTAPRYQS